MFPWCFWFITTFSSSNKKDRGRTIMVEWWQQEQTNKSSIHQARSYKKTLLYFGTRYEGQVRFGNVEAEDALEDGKCGFGVYKYGCWHCIMMEALFKPQELQIVPSLKYFGHWLSYFGYRLDVLRSPKKVTCKPKRETKALEVGNKKWADGSLQLAMATTTRGPGLL